MKTRNGFVSNSSSSSFVVAGKPGVTPTVKVVMELPVDREITSKEELDDYYLSEYSYGKINTIQLVLEDNECLQEEYNKAVEELRKGNSIFIGNVSNESDDAVSMFLFDRHIEDTLQDAVLISDCRH